MAGAVRALKELQVRPAGAGVRSELESGGTGARAAGRPLYIGQTRCICDGARGSVASRWFPWAGGG